MNTAPGSTEGEQVLVSLTRVKLQARFYCSKEAGSSARGKLLLDHKIRTLEEELAKTRFKSKSTLGEMETRVKTKNTSGTPHFWRF
jgi:hypothetical protein